MDVGISDLLLAPESEVQTPDFAGIILVYFPCIYRGHWHDLVDCGHLQCCEVPHYYYCPALYTTALAHWLLVNTVAINWYKMFIFIKILYYQFSNEEFLFSCSKTACSSARISFSRSRVSFSSASISSSIVCWGFLVLVLHFLLLGFLLFFLGFGLFVLLVPFS